LHSLHSSRAKLQAIWRGQQRQPTSLRSDMGGDCNVLLLLLPVADRADLPSADRFAARLLGDPSKKKAEGEKLPGVRPAADSSQNVRYTIAA